MFRYFDTVIEPVMELLSPRVVTEIGSDKGINTKKLLDCCVATGATLHAIDPAPQFDWLNWQEMWRDRFVFHRCLSLHALGHIDSMDLVLVDGDHNWYTVFTELRMIGERCGRFGMEFPVVLHHDVGWPYARRDVYYHPDSIPEQYLKPHENRGISPGSSPLVDTGGINAGLFNCTFEGGPQNGVLTAIEDFMRGSDLDLHFISIPFLNGLGILLPGSLESTNPELWGFIDSLTLSPALNRLATDIEAHRIEEIRLLHTLLKHREDDP